MICKTCEIDREDKFFSVKDACKSGYDYSRCKPCKKSAYDWQSVSYEKRMYNRTKSRAKRRGREFTIDLSDIVLPTHCPVFGKPFIYGDPDWTYSIDRKDNRLGYTKENIIIVSNKANRMKNDSELEELKQVYDYYSNL
jgi:hypothetical protein